MGPLAPVFAGGDGGPWQPTVTTMTTANAPAINRPFNLLVVLVMMTAKAASYPLPWPHRVVAGETEARARNNTEKGVNRPTEFAQRYLG